MIKSVLMSASVLVLTMMAFSAQAQEQYYYRPVYREVPVKTKTSAPEPKHSIIDNAKNYSIMNPLFTPKAGTIEFALGGYSQVLHADKDKGIPRVNGWNAEMIVGYAFTDKFSLSLSLPYDEYEADDDSQNYNQFRGTLTMNYLLHSSDMIDIKAGILGSVGRIKYEDQVAVADHNQRVSFVTPFITAGTKIGMVSPYITVGYQDNVYSEIEFNSGYTLAAGVFIEPIDEFSMGFSMVTAEGAHASWRASMSYMPVKNLAFQIYGGIMAPSDDVSRTLLGGKIKLMF